MSIEIPVISAQVIGRFGGGGAERLAHNLALAILERGESSACVAVRASGEYAEHATGLKTIVLGVNGALSLPSAMWRLRRAVRENDINTIHIHGAGCLPFCAVAMVGMRRRPRMVFTWHNSEALFDTHGWRGRLMLWALGHCQALFGASRSIVERLQALGPNGVPVKVFRNGVPQRPTTTGMNDDPPVICWCARLVPSKDPQVLIRAAARLRKEGLKFRVVLAGDAPAHLGWFAEQAKLLARELDVADVIEFPGWVNDLSPLLGRAAIGVQTSHAEGLSMTLLEQMMVGLAVVATDVGDTAEAVEAGVTGLLISPQDEDDLTDALRRLIVDPALRTRLGAAARERALAQFSLDNMAKQAMEAYGRVMGTPQPAAAMTRAAL